MMFTERRVGIGYCPRQDATMLEDIAYHSHMKM